MSGSGRRVLAERTFRLSKRWLISPIDGFTSMVELSPFQNWHQNKQADPSPGPQSHGLNRDRWAGRFGSIRLYPGDDSFAKLLKETFLQEAPSNTER